MNRVLAGAAVVVAVTLVGAWVASDADTDNEAVERGKYLVALGGCIECHTPLKMGPHGPEPDEARAFSGHREDAKLPPPPDLPAGPWNAITGGMTAWAGPWGISYGTNLTPDPETGIAGWTEEMFINAMRSGRHLGMGRDILPPMPRYPALSDEDLRAMLAYLMSLPPIRNQVPDPVPPASAQPAPSH